MPKPKSRSRRHRRQPLKLKLKKETLYSFSSIGLLVIAGLILLSFTRQGAILTSLYYLLADNLGWSMILLPFLLAVGGLMVSQVKWKVVKPNVLAGGILLFLGLMAATRAGNFGFEIWLSIAALLSTPGALLLLAGFIVIGVILTFNTSIEEIALYLIKFSKPLRRRESKAKAGLKPGKVDIDSLVKGKKEPVMLKDTSRPPVAASSPADPASSPVLQPTLVSNAPGETQVWEYPPLSLLEDKIGGKADRGDMKYHAETIERTLESFGIAAQVAEVNLGPAVTQYALEIAMGTKLSKITGLANDLALALAAPTGQIRIEAPIPGRSLVGVEIPNRSPEVVNLKQMLASDQMKKAKSKLTVALGLNVAGEPVVADIARMPHMLIAGATGSGKTVCINAFIASLLFRTSPAEVKFLMVDPKRVELTGYNGIPHLIAPVIVEADKVLSALNWAIKEMDNRYRLFAEVGARNIDAYNELSGFAALPYIVILVDELADIMLFAPAEVEDAICRIAQMARATGIHLVIATQRPSVDVITGLIKANIPARIAFNVSSQIDSRVIIDTVGAEKLLGRGDMLFVPPDQAKPARIQGTLVTDSEIRGLIGHLRQTGVAPVYTEEVTQMPVAAGGGSRPGAGGVIGGEDKDEFFEEAVRTICQYDRASASLLQRRLKVGYARAARILDQMEHAGVVGPADGSKAREVLTRNPDEVLGSRAETVS